MFRKTRKIIVFLSIYLLFGCDSENNNNQKNTVSFSEQMKHKDVIFIIHDANVAFCELFKNIYKDNSDENIKNVLTNSTSNTVSCSVYQRTNSIDPDEDGDCIESNLSDNDLNLGKDISLLEDTSKACVVGFDKN